MSPKVMTVSIKGAKARTEMNVGGGLVVEILDYMAKTKVALINAVNRHQGWPLMRIHTPQEVMGL